MIDPPKRWLLFLYPFLVALGFLSPGGTSAAPVLFVDFGQHTSAPLQSGYEAFTPWGSTSADNGTPVTQAYNRSEATDGTKSKTNTADPSAPMATAMPGK